MINIKEFRPGNCFYEMTVLDYGKETIINYSKFLRAKAIHSEGSIIANVNGKDKEFLIGQMCGVHIDSSILLRFNFKRVGTSRMCYDTSHCSIVINTFCTHVIRHSEKIEVAHCEFLHQLQNLYYCLHGEEMEIPIG